MTEFVKREYEELAKFQQRVSQYGLEVNRQHLSGCYEGQGTDVYILHMVTKPHPVKGNKKLIEQLVRDGFQPEVFRDQHNKMAFYVYAPARINIKEVRA